eukprot:gene13177-biopygen20009
MPKEGDTCVRSASGLRPFLSLLSSAPRPVRARCRFTQSSAPTAAGAVGREWCTPPHQQGMVHTRFSFL